ncbi:MAG TPA: OsmC family protein [Steroidobacteraceae bacterium]|jgi:organic hydroperoxide reductase OsmC/OhrA
MHPYPHLYDVTASGAPAGNVRLDSPGLETIQSAPPREFDGPGDRWSPETLLIAAIADCFVLTFRGVSRAARLTWTRLECRVSGRLERCEGALRFCEFTTHATLTVPPEVDTEAARRLLEQAEHRCLIANSLSGRRQLEISIVARADALSA